uniref:Uncharacterized protein n=1 Tax=Sphaerodactylus townsendi TaxID=933632 RepID=A0ACB8FYM1_9SAUR
MSQEGSVTGYTMYWYQQKAGQAPQFVVLNTNDRDLLIMFWPPLVLLLVICYSGSKAQSAPSQPASASVAPGNTVKRSCSSISGYVDWYQQKPGNAPRFLLYYYSESSKGSGSGVPSRFSGSKDSSGNTCYLTITGALAEDEADYYCAYWPGSAYHSDAVR